jgi:hypothetical protein
MSAKILTFSSHGDTTLLEYDPATADMEEINRVTASSLAARGVPMWSKKKSDTTQAADLEPKNLQTNPPPNPASATWDGTTKMNKEAMRPAGGTADRAPSRLGSSLHLKGESRATRT